MKIIIIISSFLLLSTSIWGQGLFVEKKFKNYDDMLKYLKVTSLPEIGIKSPGIIEKRENKIIYSSGTEENISPNTAISFSPMKKQILKYDRDKKILELKDSNGTIKYNRKIEGDIVIGQVSDSGDFISLIKGQIQMMGHNKNNLNVEFINNREGKTKLIKFENSNIDYLRSQTIPEMDCLLLATNNLLKDGSPEIALYDINGNIIWMHNFSESGERRFTNIKVSKNNEYIVAVGGTYGNRYEPYVFIINLNDGAIIDTFRAKNGGSGDKLFFSEDENIVGIIGAGDAYIYDFRKHKIILFKNRREPYSFIDGCVANDGKTLFLIGNKFKKRGEKEKDELLYYSNNKHIDSATLDNSWGSYDIKLLKNKYTVILTNNADKEKPICLIKFNRE